MNRREKDKRMENMIREYVRLIAGMNFVIE